MKVDFRNLTKFGNSSTYNSQQSNENRNVAFKGKYTAKDITNQLDSYMPKKIQVMKKLSNGLGEVQNTIINAVGTGLIAPVFIKYNFLSDTDEDTRTYSAWRQPISAVLTVGTQCAVVVPFNKVVAEMANKGVLADDYNRTAFKENSALAKEVKKQNPSFTKEQVDAEVKKLAAQQEEKLINDIRHKNTVEITKYKENGTFKVDKGVFDNAVEGAIDRIIGLEKTELKRLKTEKQVYRIRRREFYRTHSQETFDFITELEGITSKSDMKDVQKALKEKIKSLKGNKEKEELQLIAKEVLGLSNSATEESKASIIQAMQEKLAKVRKTAEKYSRLPDKAAVEHATEAELADRIKSVENTLNFYENAKKAIKEGKSVNEIEAMFKAEAKTNKRLANKEITFAKEVAEMFKKQVKGNIGSVRQMGGLVVGLAMIPIACTLLNIIYPLFMDAVFPNLSHGKNKKVNQDLVNQASNNNGEEVKHG